jgi:putative transposase
MSRPSRVKPPSPFRYFKFTPEVIRLMVLMYVRYPLSLRLVEDMLSERGYDVSRETVRSLEVAPRRGVYEDQRRDALPLASGDHEGEVLESYVTKTRNKKAALTFIKKALKRHGSPEAIVNDGLRSFRSAMEDLGNRAKQWGGRHANTRVENSNLPFRGQERAMLRFRQMKTLQEFASVLANVHNLFALERHLVDRQTYKERRSAALAEWQALAR